jgi:hypothetical protein
VPSWSGGPGVAEETNDEAGYSTALQHWNGHDITWSAGTQLAPIHDRRNSFDRTTDQHVTGLFNRLEVRG